MKETPFLGALMGPFLSMATQGKKSPWAGGGPLALNLLGNMMQNNPLFKQATPQQAAPVAPAHQAWEDPAYWQNYWKSNPYGQPQQPKLPGGM